MTATPPPVARKAPGRAGASSAAALDQARRLAAGLYAHQVEGVAFLLGRRRSILADDMGLGKTRQSVRAMVAAAPAGPYLVVCPASVKHNWAREIRLALDAPEDADPDIHIVGPRPPPRPGFAGWMIVNYDLLKRHIDALLAHRFAGLVFDEGHYIKNHRSQRSRYSRRLVEDGEADRMPVVHVLTGTPLTNRPHDLFPLLQLVGHALGRSFLAFAKRYCDGRKNDHGHWMTGGASNVAELAVQLQGIMLRRTKDEVLDLPAKQRSWVEVDVPESVREQLHDAMRAFLTGERTERGFRPGRGMFASARRAIAVEKVPQTLDFVRGAVAQGEKVIVYSCFTKVTGRLARALGDEAVAVTGKVPTAKRQELVDRFQTDESVRVFIGQIHAAGVGVNLTAARQVVFNDLDWVPANHWQAEDRAHRIGQRGTVNVTYMVARRTLEEFVRTVLETKARIVDDIVEGRALGGAADNDVLTELRRMVAHLDRTFEQARHALADRAAVARLLRAASEQYLRENAAALSPRALLELEPVAENAIAALAAVLRGPRRAVYAAASASESGVSHRLEVEGADIVCDCKGFSYRGMCRHARDLKRAFASGAPLPAGYRPLDAERAA